jgi:pimeloyl-ACP methyl ester carboxylesterase
VVVAFPRWGGSERHAISSRRVSVQGLLIESSSFPVELEDGALVVVRVCGRGPRLVLSHGNGFAIDAYRRFWERFTDRYQVVTFDFRHHGRSSPYRGMTEVWPQLIRDFDVILGAVESELGKAPSLGAFHSMSALTALLHAAEHASPWIGIVAFEPPVRPPVAHPDYEAFMDLNRKLAVRAARRRSEFADAAVLVDSFCRTASFDAIDQDGLQLLAEATLRWSEPKHLFELACAPELESSIFDMQGLDHAWPRISRVKIPVNLVAGLQGDAEFGTIAAIERDLARNAGFSFSTVSNASHFLQLEKPAECAAIVDAFHAALTAPR